MTKTLTLVDGSGFIFRAYHSLPPLTNPEGTPVGAVYGFCNMIIKLMEGSRADAIAVIFDAARKTFRNRIYEDYKAHRPPPPEDLVPQFAIVREATRALGLPAIDREDFEADDLIATYACRAREAGWNVVIVSSDKDLMQCIGEGVRMYDAMKQKIIGPEQVMEKFGVPPEKVIEVLSLIGDSSDNVPGVPGIGPKTAAELINQYGTLEELLARANEIKQPKRREALIANAQNARMSHELVKLTCDVPLQYSLEELAVRAPDPAVLSEFLQRQGFKSLLAKFQSGFARSASAPPLQPHATAVPAAAAPAPAAIVVPTKIEASYTLVRDEAALRQWIAAAEKRGSFAVDLETTSLDAMKAEIVGVSMCVEPGKACYIPLNHVEKISAPAQASLFGDDTGGEEKLQRVSGQLDPKTALLLLKPLLESPHVLKIGHNIKYDMLVLAQHGIRLSPIEDSMLLAYALHAGSHGQGMDELAELYLDYKTISYNEVTGTGRARVSFAEVELEKACAYAAEDADITLRLAHFFKPQIAQQKMLTLYETIERPLVDVLVRMERAGIRVDVAALESMSAYFAEHIEKLAKEIYALAGREFNIGSPKQLGEILFDEMNIDGGKKSAKTGAYTTDSETLEELSAQGHTIADKVLQWRQLSKLKSTYSDALVHQINPQTGRVHTSYAMAIASTGRLSSTDPNLQNIPIRTEEGRKIRHAFIAAEGMQLMSADYSQVELRLLAHIAGIDSLKESFRNGEDIHARTASEMFGVPMGEVGGDLRRSAKTINFGIIYGISAHGLATRLGIPRGEAAEYIGRYFERYPAIRDYMESCKEFARKHGYVQTLYGRRCHVPGIHDKNAARRQFSERAAINAPLQGTAADIIKRAMITIDRELDTRRARMLLQVHDELVFEVAPEAAEETKNLVKKHMEQAADLSVPLVVEVGIGANWGEIH